MDFSMDFESQANLKTLDQIDQDKALELVKSSLEQLLKPICDTPDIGVAIADGRMCPVDGPVVRHCLLNWIDDGTARAGTAGWGLLR